MRKAEQALSALQVLAKSAGLVWSKSGCSLDTPNDVEVAGWQVLKALSEAYPKLKFRVNARCAVFSLPRTELLANVTTMRVNQHACMKALSI
jgi:hypothetical protein